MASVMWGSISTFVLMKAIWCNTLTQYLIAVQLSSEATPHSLLTDRQLIMGRKQERGMGRKQEPDMARLEPGQGMEASRNSDKYVTIQRKDFTTTNNDVEIHDSELPFCDRIDFTYPTCPCSSLIREWCSHEESTRRYLERLSHREPGRICCHQ